MTAGQIIQVRRFNRLVTQRVGALDDHFLGRDRPLGQSRLLWEIGRDGAEVSALRRRLGLDAGYVSRLLRGLERKGLIRLTRGRADARRRVAQLTARGRREVALMDVRSDEVAAGLLEPLTAAQRTRLVTAMDEVTRLLRAAGVLIERVDPASAAARWAVAQYFAELDRRFPRGFDPGESLPADDDDLRPPRGAFLLATVDGEAVGCGALKTVAPRVGSLKRMWVAESARGLGLGRRLLAALEDEARSLKMQSLKLETNGTLREAIALYRGAGYREVPAFNADPYAQHWFEKTLGRRPGRSRA